MREIVLDTETTGFKPEDGHRVIEIGCVELVNHLPSGRTAQWYINPEREVPEDAVRVHGITTAFLADKPLFRDIAVEFLDFIGNAPLVAHNATFDVNFLNAELKRLALPPLAPGREIIDTVQLARRKFPSASPSTIRAAACTAPCSIRRCSPKFIWNCWAAGKPASPWPPPARRAGLKPASPARPARPAPTPRPPKNWKPTASC